MTSLSTALASLPDDALVPVGWVREKMLERSDELDLTVEDVAKVLSCAPRTARDHVASMHGAYKIGQRWLIPRRVLLQWQRERSAEYRRHGLFIVPSVGDSDNTDRHDA